MIKSIISLVLLIATVSLNIKHGWDAFHYRNNPETLKGMNDLGISEAAIPFLGLLTFAIALLTLVPRTFFIGNILNGFSILLIMSFALRSGNTKRWP